MDGGYLDMQIRQWIIRPVIAFREYIFRDVLPAFSNLNERANQIGDEYYEQVGSQPASEDFDGDMSTFAEEAQDRALSWYLMMRSLRQTMLNLLAAGLFHLTEQQLAALCRDGGFIAGPPRDTKLEEVANWYRINLRLDLSSLSSWPMIDELRFVANAVKHAEGTATRRLKSLRPELLTDPASAEIEDFNGGSLFETKKVKAPLAGEDLFVSEGLLKSYSEAVESFFREIAAHFDAHADECY
jgi:hypothetical protein